MAAVGGDILELTCNHPTVGTVTFFPKSNESSTLDLGGYRVSDDANMVDGGGRIIKQMNRSRWSAEMTIAIDENNLDQENLVAIASSPQDGDWTIRHINGFSYGGKGTVVGDIQVDKNVNTMTVKVSGGGGLAII